MVWDENIDEWLSLAIGKFLLCGHIGPRRKLDRKSILATAWWGHRRLGYMLANIRQADSKHQHGATASYTLFDFYEWKVGQRRPTHYHLLVNQYPRAAKNARSCTRIHCQLGRSYLGMGLSRGCHLNRGISSPSLVSSGFEARKSVASVDKRLS